MHQSFVRYSVIAVSAFITLTTEASAHAQTGPDERLDARSLPVAYVARPLTLPKRVFSPELNVQIARTDFGAGIDTTTVGAEVGASYGINDNLTVEARPLGFVAGDVDADYSRFQVGATYRFVRGGAVELGARLRAQLDRNRTFALNPALPVRIHAGDFVRIDTGVNLGLLFPRRSDAAVAFSGIYVDYLKPSEPGIPVDVAFQIAEPVFVGLTSGIGIATLEHAGDTTFVPLGAFAGGTLSSDGKPYLDLGGSFGFPLFFLGSSNDNPNTEIYTVGVTARFYATL